MVEPILARFWGDRLRARLGGASVAGENGLSSTGSEQSEAVEDVESGESLTSTPFLAVADALIQLSISDEELPCLAPPNGNKPASKPSCRLQVAFDDSFLFLAGEGGEETLHLLANLPRFC